jgi:hypothetical protein
MPKMETNQPRQKPDRVVLALVALTCGLVAAAVIMRRPPRERSATAPASPATRPAVEEAPASVNRPEPPIQEAPDTGAVVRTYPVYPNVSPMLKNFADRTSKKRVTPDFEARVERVQTDADMAAVVAILKDTTDSDTVRNEASKLLSRSGYPQLIPDIIAILMDPAEGSRFRSFCVQALSESHAEADDQQKQLVETVLQERLGDPDGVVQREALLALVRLGHPAGKKTAEHWLTDPAASNLRDMAIRCMATLNLREHAPEIRGYLRDTNEVIRIAAIVALSEWGDLESRSAFEEASRLPHERIQRAGKVALAKLDRLEAPASQPAP